MTSVASGSHFLCSIVRAQSLDSAILSIARPCTDKIDLPGLPGSRFGPIGDLAVAHDENRVAETDGLLERVGGQDDRDSFGG